MKKFAVLFLAAMLAVPFISSCSKEQKDDLSSKIDAAVEKGKEGVEEGGEAAKKLVEEGSSKLDALKK